MSGNVAKALLACGVASSLLYAAMITTLRFGSYDPWSQVPSELTAIGAPTRSLWLVLGAFYTALVLAFSAGIWTSSAGHLHEVATRVRQEP